MIELDAEGSARTCLSEASPAAQFFRIVICSDSERATSSLFGCFFSGGTEKKNMAVQREERKLKGS